MARDPSKTEQATPKRRNKARNEGNVPKSQELSKPLVVLAGLIALRLAIEHIHLHMQEVMRYFLKLELTTELTPTFVVNTFAFCAKELGLIVLPIMFAISLIAFSNMRLQVGSLWTTKVFQFKLKLNVFAGLQRMIASPQAGLRLVKSILQALVIGTTSYIILKKKLPEMHTLYFMNADAISIYILELAYDLTKYALIPMLLIGIADLIYTRWDYEENLKMTKDEVKDEHKQAEGDPIIKQQQRQKMMAAMQKRMMQQVPEADVVITNPTHLAIALKYDPLKAPAPIVLAKGAGHVAEKIKKIARENRVPVRENKPLARALYKIVEVGDIIPEEMFQAVATILAEVYGLRGRTNPR